MDDLERHNRRAIDALNQRGGRMLSLIDLLAFMAARGTKRRVTAVWRADDDGRHRMTWRWAPEDDRFERLAAPAADGAAPRWRDVLARAAHDRCGVMDDLRRRALDERLL